MYDARTRLAAQVADEVRAHFGERVLRDGRSRARSGCRRRRATARPCMTYDPGSTGALSYLEAARELAGGRRRTAS